ncbi:LPS export ABC transporter permease LptG [Ideonella livida]|uniref:LPS export ABC transporter permease LptG n=1 Tax=Ideonella livida TaxID=2707176 RepID=A0A7C9PHV4_9BURK|nr:LPS export ABC transporter permease LptG [Ideonella livida]NDY92169.1 LPS export ABC transporter permease LptG [Ideonella livida]
MRTVRRLVFGDVAGAVLFVALAFLALFLFIDVLDELDGIARASGSTGAAFKLALVQVPGRLYELMPIAVLIGSIYALSRMAQSSEFTILRTAGLGPGRALLLLLQLALLFTATTLALGEEIAPRAQLLYAKWRSEARGTNTLGGKGAWLRESVPGADPATLAGDGPTAISIRVGRANAVDGWMTDVMILEHGQNGRLLRELHAARATVSDAGDGTLWQLEDLRVVRWPLAAGEAVQQTHQDQLSWRTGLRPEVVAAAVSPIDSMSTLELWRYSRHLQRQQQDSQRYELQFWKRVAYPFACIVMVMLALPFAYLHARQGGISLKVFGGIMIGIVFILLNNVAGHLGLLHGWTPWLTALAPSLLFLLISLATFAWLVRYR